MDRVSKNMSFVQNVRDFDEFMGDCLVKNLCGLLEGSDSGVFVVPVSFEGIDEGIDMWFSDNGFKMPPRYRVKINVEDETGVAVFVIFDDLVQELAPHACHVLSTMDGSSSVYPESFGLKVGDVALFKVEKVQSSSGDDYSYFRVLELKREAGAVDLFFERFYPCRLPEPSFSKVDNSKVLFVGCGECDKECPESGKEFDGSMILGSEVGDSVGFVKSRKRKLSHLVGDFAGSDDLKKVKVFGS